MSQNILPRSTAPPVAPIAVPRISYEEFLASSIECHAEWVDGMVITIIPASKQHQPVSGFLASLLKLFAEVHHAGIVISAPFQMKAGGDLPS